MYDEKCCKEYASEIMSLKVVSAATHFIIVELLPGSFDIFLHEEQFFHTCQLLRITRSRQCSPQIFNLQTRLARCREGCLAHVNDVLYENFLHNIDGVCCDLLVVTETVHELGQFFREEPFQLMAARASTPRARAGEVYVARGVARKCRIV